MSKTTAPTIAAAEAIVEYAQAQHTTDSTLCMTARYIMGEIPWAELIDCIARRAHQNLPNVTHIVELHTIDYLNGRATIEGLQETLLEWVHEEGAEALDWLDRQGEFDC